MLSKEALDEFKRIYAEEIGEEIPDDLIVEYAICLLTLMGLIYRPVYKNWIDKYNIKNEGNN